jgi:hypothetical protein
MPNPISCILTPSLSVPTVMQAYRFVAKYAITGVQVSNRMKIGILIDRLETTDPVILSQYQSVQGFAVQPA